MTKSPLDTVGVEHGASVGYGVSVGHGCFSEVC
jgi:hypothetical protein